jgi:phosphoserine phosphatase RsbU/P
MSQPDRLRDRIENLQASVEELAALNEIATCIGSCRSLKDVNKTIVELVVKRLHASQGAVFLLPENVADSLQTMVRVTADSVEEGPARFGAIANGWVIKNSKPLNVSADNDPQGFLRYATEGVRSGLTIPLKTQGRIIGTLSVFNKRNADSFTLEDQRFLTIVGAQSTQVIENTRLLEAELQYASLKKELSLASEIQESFMPTTFPKLPGYDLHALNVQADEIGGDSFDAIPLGDDQVFLTLGDVCGHGVPAALMMAMAQTTIRAQLDARGEKIDDLGAFVQNISNYICRNTESNNFVTMFLALLSFKDHHIECVSAGHPPALLSDASGNIQELIAGGPPLGVIADAPFSAERIPFPAGGRLLLYSDGVTELENISEEQYESERLKLFVRDHLSDDSTTFCSKLKSELDVFKADAPPDDDITLFSILRNA